MYFGTLLGALEHAFLFRRRFLQVSRLSLRIFTVHYVQSTLSTSSEDFKSSFAERSREGDTGVRINEDE